MRFLACFGLASLALALEGRSVEAAPSGAAGYDYYRGPGGQETHAALGIAGFSLGRGDVLGGAMRFRDDLVGPGYGVMVGGGLSLGDGASLRVLGSRFLGDEGYRAWRVKTGPQWSLHGGGTFGLSWVRDMSNLGPDTDSAVGEVAVPLATGWTGRISGSVGRAREVTGYAASAGAAWTVVPHLEVAGEVGLARNPPATAPGPTGGGLLGPILGPGEEPPAATTDEVATTTLLSLRVTLP